MELKDFIKGVLTDIVNGVEEAKDELTDTGVMINPMWYHGGNFKHPIQDIEIDVSVVVDEREKTTKGIGVAKVISIGLSTEDAGKEVATHRVRFKLPVVLPVHLIK